MSEKRSYHIAVYPRHFDNASDERLMRVFEVPRSELPAVRTYIAEMRAKGHPLPFSGCNNWDPAKGCQGHPVE